MKFGQTPRRLAKVCVAVSSLMWAGLASANATSGTMFYTLFSGGTNVWKVSYSYDGTVATLGAPTAIAASPGADGILFAPSGNLLIGGAGAGRVYEYTTAGALVGSGSALAPAFHLSLDPSGSKVWTSNFGGALADLPLGPIANASALHTITGSEGGVTQIAFAPSGKVFYVNGSPNGGGNLGSINLSTYATTRFSSSVTSAHGLVYDSFTGLMTTFGAGRVGSFDPASATPGATLKEFATGVCDFDQGAIDGKGHALIAGCSGITFIDYSTSMDITSPTNYIKFFGGFSGIDDVAPLSGLGAPPGNVPEPASTALTLAALGAMVYAMRRRQRSAS